MNMIDLKKVNEYRRQASHIHRKKQLDSCKTLAEFKGMANYYLSLIQELEKQYDKLEEANNGK